MTLLLSITVSICLLSCGDVDLDIDQEQTEEPLKFIEFVLFPTAPYIDKSYVEKVPEEEVVVGQIDFDAEKEEIRANLHVLLLELMLIEDMTTLQAKHWISQSSIEYGTTTGIVYGWNDVKIYIQGNWEKEGADCQSDPSWELIDFYIRPENVSTSWAASECKGSHVLLQPGNQRVLQRHRTFLLHKEVREVAHSSN